MSLLYQSPDLALPWASSRREDRRFSIIALVVIVVVMVLGVAVQNIEVKKLSKDELKKVPDSVVKFQKRKEEKKPKPKPKVKVETKPKAEPKPEPKKEKKKIEKKPPPPKTKKEAAARAKAKKQLDAVKNELSALQDAFKPVQAPKTLTKGNTATKVDKQQIVGKATNTKGLGKVAAVPKSSNLGKLSSSAASEVGQVGLGSTAVSGTGGVSAGTSKRSAGKAGQRSEEQIRAVFDANKGALFAIYNRELRRDPTLQGKVTFEITIEPNGSVSSARIISSALNNKKLEAKLIARMRSINFGAANVAKTKTRLALDFLPF